MSIDYKLITGAIKSEIRWCKSKEGRIATGSKCDRLAFIRGLQQALFLIDMCKRTQKGKSKEKANEQTN